MRNFKAISVAIFLMVGSLAFSQVNYRLTGSGLKFHFAKDTVGKTAKIGQLVSLHMIISDASGKELKNSYKSGKPILFPVKISTFEGDIYEAVSLMSKGDSALFKIPADSMFIKVFRRPMPDGMEAGSELDVNVKVFDIWDKEKRKEHLENKVDKTISKAEKKRREEEVVAIEKHIVNEGYTMKKTEKGVYYQIIKKGKGKEKAEKGKTIVFNFEGSLLDGTVFETTYDENDVGRPFSFVLGQNQVIEGWEEVFAFLKEGDYVVMIVPSHLAFGNHAKGALIKENSPLVFTVEMRGIR